LISEKFTQQFSEYSILDNLAVPANVAAFDHIDVPFVLWRMLNHCDQEEDWEEVE
jgi:hypothetical protein